MTTVPHSALLTGIPRSGTTLCCRLLNACADTVALVEPMRVQDFDPDLGIDAACEGVARFALAVRRRALIGATLPSMHAQGMLAANVIGDQPAADGLRKPVVMQGEVPIDKPLDDQFALVIKHNALFTALLPRLQEHLPVYAVLRNPLAVLASWNSVDLPVNRGRVPAGERFAPELARRLDAEPDRLRRQLRVLDWFCDAFHRHVPADRMIRYEALVQGLHTPLPELAAPDSWHGLSGVNLDQHRRYAPDLLQRLATVLLVTEGAWWRFYGRADVEALLP